MLMNSKSSTLLSREMLEQWFGELDVLRSLRRGADFYIQQIAQSKTNYLAFGATLLQWISRREQPETLSNWLHTLPEILRGALVWWMTLPDFVSRILRRQRQQGYWPFDKNLVC
jgi:hypothetical protein